MHSTHGRSRSLVHEALVGGALGLLVLGVGSRAVMRGIALATGAPPGWTVGGTLTVIALGAAAGVAGAVLHALSRAAAARLAGGRGWVHVLLFAALLALVTARGLRGSPPGPAAAFWPLVALYGASLVRALGRRRVVAGPRAGDQLPATPAPSE